MIKSIIKSIIINLLTVLASIRLRISKYKFKNIVIAVGGCYGKSSTVAFLTNLLSSKYKVLSTYKHDKSLNSETGVAFTLLQIKPEEYNVSSWLKYLYLSFRNFLKPLEHKIIILEMGVDRPNDMRYLTSFYRPNIGILISSNNTHAANFEVLRDNSNLSYESLISYENGFIFERAKDAIFYNSEDPQVFNQITRFKGSNKFNFGRTSFVIEFTPTINGTNIVFKLNNKKLTATSNYPLLDEYKIIIQLLIEMATYFKIKESDVIKAIQTTKLPPGRCSLFKGIKNTYILDSSYNSSLVPCSSALKLLKRIAPKRKIAILGDMRELGSLSEPEHNKLAIIASQTCDIVITVGPLMKQYFQPQFEIIKKNQKIFSFDNTKQALEFIRKDNYSFLKKEDTILIKGSQNTLFLEIIVEDLLMNKKDDTKKLCRREKFYQEMREKLLSCH